MAQTTLPQLVRSFGLISAVWFISAIFSPQLMAWQNNPYAPYYYAPLPANPGYVYGRSYNNPHPQVNYYPGGYYPSQPLYYAPPYPYHTAAPATVNPSIDHTQVQKKSQKETDKAQQEPLLTVSVTNKKKLFIDQLLPCIKQENTRLEKVRERFRRISLQLERQQKVSDESKIWLKKLARKYQVSGNPLTHSAARKELLQKIGLIPASMTLAQAANESAWGQSRFATEANNLFGIWTYDEELGIVPEKRDAQKKHLVRKFDHIGESVAYFMFTLNSHPAYEKLREIRQSLREKDEPIDGHALATGLEKYSAKGELYIQLIQDLIRQNDWAQLDSVRPTT